MRHRKVGGNAEHRADRLLHGKAGEANGQRREIYVQFRQSTRGSDDMLQE